MPQKPLAWSDEDTPPQSAASNKFAWTDEEEPKKGRPDFSKTPPGLPKSHIKVEEVSDPIGAIKNAPAMMIDALGGSGLSAGGGLPTHPDESGHLTSTGTEAMRGAREAATPGTRLRGINRMTKSAMDVASPVLGPAGMENPIGLAKVFAGAGLGQTGGEEAAESFTADPDVREFAGNVGGLVGGAVGGGLRGPRAAAEPVVPETTAAEEPIPDATPQAQPVRGLLRAKPTELPPSTSIAEPEGLLDANRRVVRDPQTGRMKVQYLTSPGGKVIREGPVAPAEGIPEEPAAEAAPVPKGGIRGVQPPTGYTVEEPTEEELTKDEIAHGRSVDNPIDSAIATARAKNGARPPTHAQLDATDQRILSSKETRAALEPKGRPGETEPGIPETPAPQNGAATAAAETPAPKRNGRGVQVPLDEWEAGQEIPTNIENTRIPRQTLLKQPNGGTEPLGVNQDLTAPLQQSVDQIKDRPSTGQEGEQGRPFVDPAFSTSYGSRNKGVTAEEAAQAKKDLADKMFRSNAGFDPSMLSDAVKVGLFHLEAGAREFGAWSQKMVAELGEEVKPYLDHLWQKVTQPSIPGLENLTGEPPDAPMFYSKAARIVDQKVGGRGTGDQILATLRNSGVKEDEIKWMGLDDFLQGKTKVTKPELQEFIRDNQIQLVETSLGEEGKRLRAAVRNAELDVDSLHGALGRELVRQGVSQLDVANWPWQVREGRLPIESLPARGTSRTIARELLEAHEKMMRAKDLENDYAVGGRQAGGPKYEGYTLPGPKDDYTEMLLRLPTDQKGETFKASHFEQPNILAHVRFDVRMGEDGTPMLFIEEVQSDWHQQGKRLGYQADQRGVNARLDALDAQLDAIHEELKRREPTIDPDSAESWQAAWDKHPDLNQEQHRLYAERGRFSGPTGGVLNAPFKSDWHELAMKRMLRYAAENGFDRIGWVTGDQTADRYDLSKHVDRMTYDPEEQIFQAYDHDGSRVIHRGEVGEKELEELIGKGLADELLSDENAHYPERDEDEDEEEQEPAKPDYHEMYGSDLKIGGEWANNLYDRAIPHFLNKYGKKWGAKVDDSTVAGGSVDPEDTSLDETPFRLSHTGRISATRSGSVGPLFWYTDEYVGPKKFEREADAHQWLLLNGYLDQQVHSMPITPAMKKSVLKEGQPISENRAAPPPHEIPEFAIPA